VDDFSFENSSLLGCGSAVWRVATDVSKDRGYFVGLEINALRSFETSRDSFTAIQSNITEEWNPQQQYRCENLRYRNFGLVTA